MKDYKIIRIRWKTFQRLKKEFPPADKESLVNYFDRISKKLKGLRGIEDGDV